MTRTYVMCRTATQPLVPGCVLGYECQVCHHPLQVSPVGVKAIRYDGGIPLCNPLPQSSAGQKHHARAVCDPHASGERSIAAHGARRKPARPYRGHHMKLAKEEP